MKVHCHIQYILLYSQPTLKKERKTERGEEKNLSSTVGGKEKISMQVLQEFKQCHGKYGDKVQHFSFK